MFESDTQTSSGRYQMRIVSGEMRQKSHQKTVQEALDEGSARGWVLVSATGTDTETTFGSNSPHGAFHSDRENLLPTGILDSVLVGNNSL